MGTISGGNWNYSGSPSASNKDAVRFLIGDTDGANQLVSDEEIDFALVQFSNIYNAAALVCDQIASEQSGDGSKKIGDLAISGGRSAKAFTAKASRFRRLAALGATPYAGGLSVTDAANYTTDADQVQPAFTVGEFDNPQGLSQPGPLSFIGSTST